jgi:hypothetical protein
MDRLVQDIVVNSSFFNIVPLHTSKSKIIKIKLSNLELQNIIGYLRSYLYSDKVYKIISTCFDISKI